MTIWRLWRLIFNYKNLKNKIEILGIIVAIVIWILTIFFMFQQTSIMEEQNRINEKNAALQERQVEISEQNTKIQNEQYNASIFRDSRDKMNVVFDKVTFSEPSLVAIHRKMASWEKVQDLNLLDKYISEFEDIWALYCDGKVRLTDLRWVLKNSMKGLCWNAQVYNYYQNTKSGVSSMCEKLFPWSSVMAKYADSSKCTTANNK